MEYDVIKEVSQRYDSIQEVQKFNPYHGSDGRFASSSGYASFTIRTKDPKKQHMADMAIAREKERDAARRANEGPARVSAAETQMKKLLGENTTIKLQGCDPDVAEEAAAAVQKVVERYPIAKDAIKGITTDDIGDHFKNKPNVMAAYDNSTRKIHLNTKYYGDKAGFDKAVKEAEEKQFHPKDTKSDSVIVHEIGHAIDHRVSELAIGQWEANWGNDRVSTRKWNNDIRAAQRKGEPLTSQSIKEGLSGYASKDAREYFAEGFAEGMMSPSPRKTATSIMKHLDSYVKKAETNPKRPRW